MKFAIFFTDARGVKRWRCPAVQSRCYEWQPFFDRAERLSHEKAWQVIQDGIGDLHVNESLGVTMVEDE